MDNQGQPLDKSLQKDLQKYEDTQYDSLIKQIDTEYNLSWLSQYERLTTSLNRLKLYNNQRKNKDAVGDLTLFTTHQTILASLYDDELSVNFVGREQGDEDKADNLNALAKFDYPKMEKNILDYMWDWDALFYGRGLVEMIEFDRDKEYLCPIPEGLDPATFLHDPKAAAVNGFIRGRGAMRFGGRELWLNKPEMTDMNGYFNTKWLRSDNEMKSLLIKAEQERNAAQNLQQLFNREAEGDLGDNALVAGLKWYTNWKGKMVMVVLAQKRTRIVKYLELDNQKRWPIIDRPMYPNARDWNGTSIPDLCEDKQRQRSVVTNLGIQAMKSDLYPMYLYDEDRVKNRADLLKFENNKFVGLKNNEGKDVRGAVQPMNKPSINWGMVNFILETLDASTQKATATPDMQSGSVEEQKRTLGELNLVASKVDVRYSLSSKVFGWSEKEFWSQWYNRYKENYVADVDTKVIRLVGVQGYSYVPLMKDDFITGLDPDIEIESAALSEASRMKERLLFQNFGQVVMTDPDANKRYYEKHLAKLNGMKKDEVDMLFPPTVDELIARFENETLNHNKMVQVHPLDNHMQHLIEHQTAEETAAKQAHIAAHIEAMRIQKTHPQLFPQQQQDQQGDQNGQPATEGQPTPQIGNNPMGQIPVQTPQTTTQPAMGQ